MDGRTDVNLCTKCFSSGGTICYLIFLGPSKQPSYGPEKDFATHDAEEDLTRMEPSRYFQCGDGEIISILGKCDGKRDCINGRDEDHCQNSSTCVSNRVFMLLFLSLFLSFSVCLSVCLSLSYDIVHVWHNHLGKLKFYPSAVEL